MSLDRYAGDSRELIRFVEDMGNVSGFEIKNAVESGDIDAAKDILRVHTAYCEGIRDFLEGNELMEYPEESTPQERVAWADGYQIARMSE